MYIYLTFFAFTEKYWSNAHNRRKFFIEFAVQKGFDPLLAVNWKNIRCKQVKRTQQAQKKGSEKRQTLIKI